jgi:hypothetical protein
MFDGWTFEDWLTFAVYTVAAAALAVAAVYVALTGGAY